MQVTDMLRSLEVKAKLFSSLAQVDLIPMPVPATSPGKLGGSRYQRICLEKGLELHFWEDNPEAKKSAEEIVVWFSNQKKEG